MGASRFILAVLFTASLFGFSAQAGIIEDAISERLAPVGEVCVEGQDCGAASAAAAVSSASEPRSGEAVYNGGCNACHASGAAGAPKLGDVAAWSERLAQGNDTLYSNAIDGINEMPAKGLCMNCSDDEIKAAVDYMIDNSK